MMAYVHIGDDSFPRGSLGCSPGCPCRACRPRTFGEWYLREEPDEASDGRKQRRPLSHPAIRARSMAMLGEPAPTIARPIEIIGGFAFDRTNVVPAEHAKLIRVARLILGGARGPILLVGHTDPVGTQAYNLDLGRRRAIEVQRRLVS